MIVHHIDEWELNKMTLQWVPIMWTKMLARLQSFWYSLPQSNKVVLASSYIHVDITNEFYFRFLLYFGAFIGYMQDNT